MPSGLRERKKRRTRETIIRVALDLFAERGYEATKIADIAAAADIAPRTFFGYFPTKEDVVFHDADEVLESLAARVRDRPAGETTLDALAAWLREMAAGIDPDDEMAPARRRLIRATPALAGRQRSDLARFEALLAEAVARDLGVSPDSLRAHLTAAAAAAALEALGSFYEDRVPPAPERVQAILDETLLFLRGGFEALRDAPAA